MVLHATRLCIKLFIHYKSAAVQNTVSATAPVPLYRSQCTVCLCPDAVQSTVSATAPVPLCRTVSVQPVSVLLQYRTHCLLLHLSLSAAQSVYCLSLSWCSAEYNVCYCTCPSLPHSQCTVCLCPAAVQNTVTATAPVPLYRTVSVLSVSVLLQCRTQCLLLRLSLSTAQSVYCLSLSWCSAEYSVCLSLSWCSAEYNVCYCTCPSLPYSQCTACLCPAAVQNTVSATASVPFCSTVSVLSVSALPGRHITQVTMCSSMAALWFTAHTHHHV
jgi:hypothetical protein